MSAEIINIFDYTPRFRSQPEKPAEIIILPVIKIEHSTQEYSWLVSPSTSARTSRSFRKMAEIDFSEIQNPT